MAQSTFHRRLEEIAAQLRQAGLRPVPTGPGSLRSISELELRVAALERSIDEAVEDISATVERLEARLYPENQKFRKTREARLGTSLQRIPTGPVTAPPVVSQTGQLPNVQSTMRIAPPQASMPVPTPHAPGPAQPSHQFAPATPAARPPLSAADFPPGVPASVLAAATGVARPAEELTEEVPEVATVQPRAPIPVVAPPMIITPSIARALAAQQAAEDAAVFETEKAAQQALEDAEEEARAAGSVETTAEPVPEAGGASPGASEADARDTEPPATERPPSAP